MNQEDETTLQEVVYKPTTKTSFSSKPLKPELGSNNTNFFPYIAAATASLMASAVGSSFGWTSPVLPKLLTNDTDVNPLGQPIAFTEESWITGFLCLGAMVGSLGAGTMADKFGRKKTLLFLTLPMAISIALIAFAKSVTLYYVLRFTLGIGAGSVFTVLPMYLAEIAEDHNRGALGCFIGTGLSCGLLFTYMIGPYLTVRTFTLTLLAPIAIFVTIFSYWIPETPHHLAAINDREGLELSLMQLRKKLLGEVQQEAAEIVAMVQEEKRHKGGVKDLFKTRGLRKGLVISIGLIMLQQFSGINAVLCYMQTIFKATGGGLAPEISTIIVGVVQVITAILTSYIVEKLGRKILMLMSLIGCGVSLVALGGYFYLKLNDGNVDCVFWLPVSSLLVYIIAFSIGLGPLPWAVMAELFPANVKSTAATLTSFSFFLGGFVICLLFPIVSLTLGMANTFWIFAVACALGTVFVYCILPETKGKSLQEIQRLLEA